MGRAPASNRRGRLGVYPGQRAGTVLLARITVLRGAAAIRHANSTMSSTPTILVKDEVPFFKGAEYTSVPGLLHFRFLAQFISMGELAWPKDEFGKRLMPFVDTVLPELSYVFDKRARIESEIAAYKAGIADGRLYKVNERNQTNHDKSKEKEISDLAKDFFIHLKLCVDNTFSGVR